jgi:phosphoribosylamine--glycine ligase
MQRRSSPDRLPEHPRTLVDMKILVVGSGAREHAVVRALVSDPAVEAVTAAPGNAGIAADAPCEPIDLGDAAAIGALAKRLGVDLVVIGPEAPLVAGAADEVRALGIPCFGPSAAAARLEGSKAFAKQVMAAAHVPTAQARSCTTDEEVTAALVAFGPPYVVKDDGLAAGKGVVVTEDHMAARMHADAVLARGGPVLIEEFLDGPEVSLFVITDGSTALPLLPAQDFKRVGEGDTGPNTGGMGAYAPLPWAEADLVDRIMHDVAEPTIDEMARRGIPFVGVLYCGLALTSRGPKVVEFNCRFGDPEVQAVLALLDTPLAPLLLAAASGELAGAASPAWRDGAAVNVVIAAEGYPAAPAKGDAVAGLAAAAEVPGVTVLHAGTEAGDDGEPVTAGGRVLSVVAVGSDVLDARTKAYQAAALIQLRGGHYRRDIADPAAWS